MEHRELDSRTTKIVDVGWVSIPSFSENNHHGILRVFESAAIPFHLQRIFQLQPMPEGFVGNTRIVFVSNCSLVLLGKLRSRVTTVETKLPTDLHLQVMHS